MRQADLDLALKSSGLKASYSIRGDWGGWWLSSESLRVCGFLYLETVEHHRRVPHWRALELPASSGRVGSVSSTIHGESPGIASKAGLREARNHLLPYFSIRE